jgi:hypothetical protein
VWLQQACGLLLLALLALLLLWVPLLLLLLPAGHLHSHQSHQTQPHHQQR